MSMHRAGGLTATGPRVRGYKLGMVVLALVIGLALSLLGGVVPSSAQGSQPGDIPSQTDLPLSASRPAGPGKISQGGWWVGQSSYRVGLQGTPDRHPVAGQDSFGYTWDDTVVCELGTLAAGQRVEFGLWAKVDPTAADGGQLINEACVAGSAGADDNPANDCSTAWSLVKGRSDLAVTKTAVGQVMGPGGVVTEEVNQVTAGLSLVYTLLVENYNTAEAQNVVVVDTLPVGILVSGVTASQGSCSPSTSGDGVDLLTCGLGALGAGASATIVIEADVPASMPGGTMLENGALVSGDLPDLTNANDHVINLTAVGAWADLSVTKVQEPPAAMVGAELAYIITVMNAGPSDAPWTVVSDTMPAQLGGVTWECISFKGATCPASGSGDIEREVDLPAGGKVVFTINALRETDGEDLVNTAEVIPDAGVNDPDPSNNMAVFTNGLYRRYLPVVMRDK